MLQSFPHTKKQKEAALARADPLLLGLGQRRTECIRIKPQTVARRDLEPRRRHDGGCEAARDVAAGPDRVDARARARQILQTTNKQSRSQLERDDHHHPKAVQSSNMR